MNWKFLQNGKKKEKEKKVTCSGCKNLIYNNDGSVYCSIHREAYLEFYNKYNIRPCKENK